MTAPSEDSGNSKRRIATLSLDLDNEWSYLKTHGDEKWKDYPSYLHIAVPRFLAILKEFGLTISVFVVGKDAEIESNHLVLRSIAAGGHEIGNHSYCHEPWLHLRTRQEIEKEIRLAADLIVKATGVNPKGFRGPGYSLSAATIETLAHFGYRYDASTLPTFIGPLARLYYFMTSRFSREERETRKKLFGTVRDALRPLRPYLWSVNGSRLLEVPVTTMPLFRVPFHISYILYISTFSPLLARLYWRLGLKLCAWRGVAPSILMHPLDFLGKDDISTLDFFPGMSLGTEVKLERTRQYLSDLVSQFTVMPLGAFADLMQRQPALAIKQPQFAE